MPYSNPKQAVAVFLNIRRRQGERAAKAFAKRHPDDMARGAKAAAGNSPYKGRSK